jgi:multiple sugar transport system ATP-binding protein
LAQIRFQGIEKRFKDVVVVKELNLTIEDREFFTFVGPSGCGKSTILSMIAGLEDVSSGTILFDKVPINDLSPGERDVAMVFQSYALYPHMTVYENISFPLRVRNLPKETIDSEINRVASILGLETLLKRKPKELSGGQRQRVALGRALIRKPRVFLMDEPLSNLDAKLRIDTRAELKRLHRELQITTIYVTHDQEEAMVLSDRIAVLFNGAIQQCGHPMEVYAKPANLFVAGFIGNPPMNIIDGSLLKGIAILKPIFQPFEKKEIVVGIRPSDLIIGDQGDEAALEGEVLLLEPTGSDMWVDVAWKEIKVRGKVATEEKIAPGVRAFLKIPVEKLHVFDRTSGERLA